MNSFAYRVARIYYNQYHEDISRYCFVFPNRRAGIFFQHYISQLADKPLFSPQIITIDDCFQEATAFRSADRLSMLFRLFRLYQKLTRTEESFDSFVYWAEIILSDFNDIDKYLVDARQLFTNIKDLKEIDSLFDIFNEEQVKAIREFWIHFNPANLSKTQVDFLTTWDILFPLYESFREELTAEGIAYEGMMQRALAVRLDSGEQIDWLDDRQFVFIGFNALNPCERKLMLSLQKRAQADFYWDYESAELQDPSNPASRFYKENTLLFPSRFTLPEAVHEQLSDKQFELISLPSVVGQAKEVHYILDTLFPEGSDESAWLRTAVLLPDEHLLLPLLHSIPEQISRVNVTMGYPLHITSVAGLIDHIFELHKRKKCRDTHCRFYYQTVLNILNHQLMGLLCSKELIKTIIQKITNQNLIYVDARMFEDDPLLRSIFNPQMNTDILIASLLDIIQQLVDRLAKAPVEASEYQLMKSFLYQYYITLNRMADLMAEQSESILMSQDTLTGLIRQLTASISIPFVGEPLNGLQIMGMLEARGLDFDTIIVCSFNEGVIPSKNAQNSFVPYHLRKGFQLPTYEHQDSISSYNFYRLLHRAQKIYFISDSRVDKGTGSEVSRYIHQLRFHYGLQIPERNVVYDVTFPKPESLEIAKSPLLLEKLRRYMNDGPNGKALSASSINTYITCPLQFYFRYLGELEQPDELSETVENNVFGNIFHQVMAALYEPYVGKIVQEDDFKVLINNKDKINELIALAFAQHYFNLPKGQTIELEGNNLLIAKVIRKYVIQLLKKDSTRPPFRYIAGEKYCKTKLSTLYGDVRLHGVIDRIDEQEGSLHIMDYKTGRGQLSFRNWDEVFSHELEYSKRPTYVLQTFLYGLLYKEVSDSTNLTPGICYIKNIFRDDFSTTLQMKSSRTENFIVDNYFDFEDDFIIALTQCVEEIFNPELSFTQTACEQNCIYCEYKSICRR